MKPSANPLFTVVLLLCVLSATVRAEAARPKKKAKTPAVEAVSAADTMQGCAGKVTGRFIDYYARGIQEKLYLQLDKPYYCSGDTVWLKGYLLNAFTHKDNMPDKYIYVELADRSGRTLIRRIKICRDEHGFHGMIPLDARLAAGDYILRAYSRWMTNWDEGLFFSRPLTVANPVDTRIISRVTYEKLPDGQVRANVNLRNAAREPLKNTYVDIGLDIGQNPDDDMKTKGRRTDREGSFSVTFKPLRQNGSIRMQVEDPNAPEEGLTLFLPDFGNDFDVQFFPEGGPLLAGQVQRIAFKAIGSNGLSVEVTGEVCDSEGQPVQMIESRHKGMGVFGLIAEPGKTYHARLRSGEGIEKRFDLPAVSAQGYALTAARSGESIVCDVFCPSGQSPAQLALVIQAHGRIAAVRQIEPGQPVRIPYAGAPEGIVHLTLIDRDNLSPLSERLMFIPRKNKIRVSITPDQPSYDSRQAARLNILVTDSTGQPMPGGTFAVSVTDRTAVERDPLPGDIYSYLMLSSEVKGHVEEPGYYFMDDSPERLHNLDLLLMTQGWSRFEISDILAGRLTPPAILPEQTQDIEGEILNFFGGPRNKATATLLSPQLGHLEVIELSETHRFRFVDLDFPDGTTFSVQASKNSGGKFGMQIEIKPDSFPALTRPLPAVRTADLSKSALPDKFLSQSRERYFLEGGMQIVNLEAVRVTGRVADNHLHGAFPDWSLKSEEIENALAPDIFTLLMNIPKISVDQINGTVKTLSGQPLVFYLEEFEIPIEQVKMLLISNIARIDVVIGAMAVPIMGMAALESGAIVISVKDKNNLYGAKPDPLSITKVRPLGYQARQVFYQPAYDLNDVWARKVLDLRTTVLWDPRLTASQEGTAHTWFFTSDAETVYDIILEGVAADGSICRTQTTVRNTNPKHK